MGSEIHNIICAADVPTLLEKEALFVASHPGYDVSVKRYFLSSIEQKERIKPASGHESYVIQPVLGEDKVAVWIMLIRDCPVELVWHTNLYSNAEGPEAQTADILNSYEADLAASGLDISEHCVRTWFFVDDIDNNYSGVVKARRDNFESLGMTKYTHYLASTGIGGGSVYKGSCVQMDALAIKGDFSQHYLYAPENFNPTHEYGVTFERGVVVDYGGTSHVLISGTASINNRGEIVHPGDVRSQTLRMLENVEALLSEAGIGWKDVQMMVVYLRNADDYAAVSPVFRNRFDAPGIPYVITHAPVCRPGWLIEMECIGLGIVG